MPRPARSTGSALAREIEGMLPGWRAISIRPTPGSGGFWFHFRILPMAHEHAMFVGAAPSWRLRPRSSCAGADVRLSISFPAALGAPPAGGGIYAADQRHSLYQLSKRARRECDPRRDADHRRAAVSRRDPAGIGPGSLMRARAASPVSARCWHHSARRHCRADGVRERFLSAITGDHQDGMAGTAERASSQLPPTLPNAPILRSARPRKAIPIPFSSTPSAGATADGRPSMATPQPAARL